MCRLMAVSVTRGSRVNDFSFKNRLKPFSSQSSYDFITNLSKIKYKI